MPELIEMDYDEWFDTYKPIPNHIDENASFSDGEYGYMFETYGDELTFIQGANDNVIWTYGDGDDGGTYIWSGYSFINRIGYFITERPWVNDVQALVMEPSFECDECVAKFTSFDELIHDEENDSYLCAGCAPLDLLNK